MSDTETHQAPDQSRAAADADRARSRRERELHAAARSGFAVGYDYGFCAADNGRDDEVEQAFAQWLATGKGPSQ